MAFNELIAKRIRALTALYKEEFTEKRMFGGLSFLYKGKMTVGIVKDQLAVRVIESKLEKTLKKPHIKPMDFTKKPMKEFVYVEADAFDTEEKLLYFIELGLEHAKSKLNEI
ncbi:TfoX/Sxy family protein [Pseudofulvibacter geojedonensis]|uniref:TfoX/Sxy family protein n=1 Tax=Pseudofulvibacter geojedonensis TaxID=1123758 RepID=A0ABW3I2U0_9FLAO